MKSKANLKGHPIHPILAIFPIAFFTGAFLSDTIFICSGKAVFAEMAKYLESAGIIGAIMAAIPGAIDFFYTVPPESSANTRATRHAILNGTMLLCFTVALFIRRSEEANFSIVLSLEGAGVIMLCIAGWLGGTLVSRNQIGIDHRYAGAGKWKEEIIKTDSGRIELKDLGKLHVNQVKLLHVNGKRIAIAKTESEYLAFEDRCTHNGGSLADGALICGTVQCPWHGSQFNIKNGAVITGPAKKKIKTYKIGSAGQKHYLHLD